MRVRALSPAVGAEITGVRLNALSNSEMADIRQAFSDHGVLVFRDQDITPDDHRSFALSWGEIVVNRFFTPLDDHPDIAEVRKEPHQKKNIGAQWHTDHSYDTEPALGSVLVARELPLVGGDTLFAGMAAAYDVLSDGLKETLDRLKAVHSSVHSFGYSSDIDWKDNESRLLNPEKATQTVSHPIAITHPLSGKKCVYVNPEFTTHIEGWTKEESASLLRFLYDHVSRPEFTCRLRWEEGTVAFWDNRATQHCALNDYHGHRRVMHRITIAGEALQ